MPAAGVGLQGATDRKGATEMADLGLLAGIAGEFHWGAGIAAAARQAEQAVAEATAEQWRELDAELQRRTFADLLGDEPCR